MGGGIIVEKKDDNSSFQIDVRNFSPGIYIIHNEKSKSII